MEFIDQEWSVSKVIFGQKKRSISAKIIYLCE